MIALRRISLAALLIVGCLAAGGETGTLATAQTAPSAAPAAAQPAATATAKEVQVDLLRGLADIFSRGMDTLADRLNRQGYSARVYSTHGWTAVARRIAERYYRGHRDIIVIVGHSLGANAALDVANELNRRNIPVELVVTFDATNPYQVPKNVLHLINFYQRNGFGKVITPGAGFTGELSNVDLTADMSLSHTTIEKSPRLHALVMQKIADIVNKDLAARLQAAKPSAAKSKKPQAGKK
jgi:thioesterase domain-containing protein